MRERERERERERIEHEHDGVSAVRGGEHDGDWGALIFNQFHHHISPSASDYKFQRKVVHQKGICFSNTERLGLEGLPVVISFWSSPTGGRLKEKERGQSVC
uniref:Uncharacterized protein n=1 Tax=Lotus japonicus TaxID=34305 RepID=I3S9J1_LOTJA|nr:unknown [Lotus japonicus]